MADPEFVLLLGDQISPKSVINLIIAWWWPLGEFGAGDVLKSSQNIGQKMLPLLVGTVLA